MASSILALNAGSSSFKFAVFAIGPQRRLDLAVRGEMEGIGAKPHFAAQDAKGNKIGADQPDANGDPDALPGWLLQWVQRHLGNDRLVAVGHRVVHGGPDFSAPVRVTPETIQALERLTPLAPLHQPHSLAPVRAILAAAPALPQVACFDTAFHHTMPDVAKRLALPRTYWHDGIRRYGFHGLSYEFIAGHLREIAPELAAGRVIVAHLGSGASLCAMQNGKSVDTTMGFTALDGLVMGTRCGTLDPGVVLYLLQEKRLSPDQIEHLLYKESGLLGISETSSDMRVLTANADPRAQQAVDSFVFRVAREAGALASSLGGLDGLVFTAGIGEHAPVVRAAICARLEWLGLSIDRQANAHGAGRIGTATSQIDVRIMPTDEALMIARHTETVLSSEKSEKITS